MKTNIKTATGTARIIARGLESIGSPERIQELADLMMEMACSRSLDASMASSNSEAARAEDDADWLMRLSDAFEDVVGRMMKEAHGPDASSPGTLK